MNDKKFDYEEQLKKYFWYGYLDINKRLEILHNNNNWFLEKKDLIELLEKTAAFWKWRKERWKYKTYIKKDYDDFLSSLKEEVKKNTSLSPESDAILLWANHKNIIYYINWELEINEKIKEKTFTKYTIKELYELKEIKNILDNEFFLLDTETTWFNELNQIIEFGWIIYNRKVDNSDLRLKEVLNVKNIKSNSILSIFKYIQYDFLKEKWFFIIKEYATLLEENSKYKKSNKEEERIKYFSLLEELSNKLKDYLININKKEFDYLLVLIDDFNLVHNRKIHFYIKPYKDYITDITYNVHHITNDLITEKGIEIDKVWNGLYKILENQHILAHNVWFDMTKIVELFNDLKLKWPKVKGFYDTINIFQVLNNELDIWNKITKFNLDYLSKVYLGVNLNLETENTKDRHTAIFDVKLTKSNIDKVYNDVKKYKDNLILIKEKEKIVKERLKEEEKKFNEKINNYWNLDQNRKNEIKKLFKTDIIDKILNFNDDTFVYNEINHIILNLINKIDLKNNEIKDYLLKNVKEELYMKIEDYLKIQKENKKIKEYYLINLNKSEWKSKRKKIVTSENNLTLF